MLVCIIVCSFVAVVILEYNIVNHIMPVFEKNTLCVRLFYVVPIKKDLAKKTVFSYTSLSYLV